MTTSMSKFIERNNELKKEITRLDTQAVGFMKANNYIQALEYMKKAVKMSLKLDEVVEVKIYRGLRG